MMADGKYRSKNDAGRVDSNSRETAWSKRGGTALTICGVETRGSTLAPGTALSWLNVDTRARIIVAAPLRLVWSNAAADAILAKLDDITLHDQTLVFASAASQRLFCEFITRLGPQMASLALPRGGHLNHLLVNGCAVETDNGRLACLEISLGGPGCQPRYHDLTAVFGLTNAEARVAEHLLAGHTATLTAQQLSISTATVRTHIRRLYSKIDVTSREELLGKIQRFRIL